MRTTLDIDDEVLHAAKEIARHQGRTTGSVISELARRALTQSTSAPKAMSEAAPFFGFRPLPADGRIVSSETIGCLREEEGI